jgi:ribosomal-protein-alanine N-acetyltransferase
MNPESLAIQTDRLLLRKFEQEDIHHVFKGLSHPKVIRYYGIHFNTPEATQIQMDWYKELEENGTGRWFAVCTSDHKVFYGGCGLNNIRKEHKKAKIGFWLLPEYWGIGIMTEAIPLVCNHGFQQLDMHRIEAFVETENMNSKKTLQKTGFMHEGTMVDCEMKNEDFISLDIYAKIRH